MYLIPSTNVQNIRMVNRIDHNLRSLLHFLVLVLRLCVAQLLFTRVVPLPLLVNNPSIRVWSKQWLLGSIASNHRTSAPEQTRDHKEGQKNHVQPLWSPHEAQLQLTLICRGIVVLLVEVQMRTLGVNKTSDVESGCQNQLV